MTTIIIIINNKFQNNINPHWIELNGLVLFTGHGQSMAVPLPACGHKVPYSNNKKGGWGEIWLFD